jgi:hypothetical protein
MPERGAEPRALFLFPDEPPQPDVEVCSGRYRNWLGGKACPYSEDGRLPRPKGADPVHQESVPAPPCVEARLGRLSDWQGERGLQFPQELGGQPLLKCKQMFLLVLATGWKAGPEVELRRYR